jgi:hypothetical protein
MCLGSGQEIIKDWNRTWGVKNILLVGGIYLLGQLIIWGVFFNTIRNQKVLS